jgi:hypothetical protein
MAVPIKKPGIPSIYTQDLHLAAALTAMKENIETITGARPKTSPLTQLASTADLSAVIGKINEVIARINYTGE